MEGGLRISAGGMLPQPVWMRRWLYQSTHSNVANSILSKVRYGPRRLTRLGFIEAVNRFRECVVIKVPDAAHRGCCADLDETFGVAY